MRKDIRSSFDGKSGTADGVPYTMQFTVVDVDNDCEPLTGAAVYVWHCDREGDYSMYEDASDAELPARRAGGRRQRRRVVHQHLPRVLLGSLAARALRGLPECRRRDERRRQARRPRSSRSPRTRATRCTPRVATSESASTMRAGLPRLRHGVLRRRRDADAVDDRERHQWVRLVPRGRSVGNGLTGVPGDLSERDRRHS